MSSRADRSHRLERATAFLMGISLAGGGLQALSGGKRWITNYLSIPIPAAAALAAGAVVAVGALTLPIRSRHPGGGPPRPGGSAGRFPAPRR